VSQDGFDRPGSFSVLSIVVRPDLPARIALHLRPAAVEDEPDDRDDDRDREHAWAGPEAATAWH
jgi:hypothetical protein